MNAANISPDLQRSMINTIYLTFTHNYIAIAYFTGIIISLGIAIYRPSRFTILFFLGFALLLFGYEYDKHIINAFREQTLNSLATEVTHRRLQKLINLIISDVLPIFFYVTGWLFIYIAIIYGGLKLNKKKGEI